MAKRGLHIKKGDVYGFWIALEDDECINERRYVKCKCECGEIKTVRVDGLLKGTSTNCGCKKSPKTESLIGKRYGNLTVIGSASKTSRKSILCRCDCGNIVTKHQSMVLNGTRTSCGKCDYVQVKIGDIFGRWTVIGVGTKDENSYHKKWKCQCSCEKHTIADIDEQNLKHGLSLSCGCLISEVASVNNRIHGETNTRLHHIWCSMRERCKNPNVRCYKDYGGRGIKICDEWNEYISFRDWALNNGYREDLTIDRINVNDDYKPSNCRWATVKEQNNNKRNSVKITYKGKEYSAYELEQMLHINAKEIRRLYKKGLNMEEIIIKKGVMA